jgi:pimeloyl-ACP methyl ester carboxylesterase
MSALPTPPGRLIDIGGYKLHLWCQGSGSPAVILDSGLAGNSLLWACVLPLISSQTQACAFDRAGYAWSDPAPDGVPRTSQQIVNELHLALAGASISPPYILVGHSFGAINMLVFAYNFPAEVAGLILVDPSHPEMMERVPGVPSAEAMQRSYAILAGLGRLGLLRWLGPLLMKQLLPQGRQTMPPDAWDALIAFASRPDAYHTASQEASFGRQSFKQARGAPGSLGSLPLEVLCSERWVTGKITPMKRMAAQLHAELASLSSRGRYLTVSNCDHADLPVVRPDAVDDSVRHILNITRSAQ